MKNIIILVTIIVILLGTSTALFGALVDGKVESGSASITANGLVTDVVLHENNTVVKTPSANQAPKETWNITGQPGWNFLLGVTGPGPSTLAGTTNAPWINFFFVNPNGIYIAPTANINANSFIASTLNISTNNFIHGTYILEHTAGSPYGYILNEGRITASNIALIASAVNNSGVLIAKAGTVNLASGDKVTVSFDMRGLMQVVVNKETSGYVYDIKGVKLIDAIKNSKTGTIEATQVMMTAKTAANIFENAINNSGVVRATTLVAGENGKIRMVAEGAPVINTGTIEAGDVRIEVKGADFTNIDMAKIIADGARERVNGGNIYIGAFNIKHGGVISANAYEGGTAGNIEIISDNSTVLDENSSTSAACPDLYTGNGGRILINSRRGSTTVNRNAMIDVSAGAISGDGGFVEVSALDQVGFYGVLNGRAPPGYRLGTAIIDPTNASIGNVIWPTVININTYVWATNNITILGNITIGNNVILYLLADHKSAAPGDWDNSIGAIINSGAFIIAAGPGATGTCLNLKAGSGIGTEANPIRTNIHILSAQINPNSASGSIYIIQGSTPIALTYILSRGDVRLQAGQNITLGYIAALNNVTLISDSGAIINSNGGNLINIISKNLILRAAAGIGSNNPIKARVSRLSAYNSTSGNIRLYNYGRNLTIVPYPGEDYGVINNAMAAEAEIRAFPLIYVYNIDGDLIDWNVSLSLSAALEKGYLDANLPLGSGYGVEWTTEDNAGNGLGWQYVGPGWTYNGNNFDNEAVYFDNDQNNVYIAIVQGLPITGGTAPGNPWFYPGDIGIDTNGDGIYEYAIDVSTYDPVNRMTQLYGNVVWKNVHYTEFSESNPWAINTGALLGTIDFVYSENQNSHFCLEARIPLSLLGLSADTGDCSLAIHWVQECGNDSLKLTAGLDPVDAKPNLTLNASVYSRDGTVTLSAAGSIIDANGGTNSVIANNLNLYAVDGIGPTGPLKTQVSFLQATNTTTGDINIVNAGSLTIISGGVTNTAPLGNVKITTNSDLIFQAPVTAAKIVSLIVNGALIDDNPGYDVIADSLEIRTAGGIHRSHGSISEALDTRICKLAAYNSGTGNIIIFNTGALDITTVGSTSGIVNDAAAGNIRIETSNLEVCSWTFIDMDTGMVCTAEGISGNLFGSFYNLNINQEVRANGGDIYLWADKDVNQNAAISTNTAGKIDVNAGNTITMAEGTKTESDTGEITYTSSSSFIKVVQLKNNGKITVIAYNGSIIDNNGPANNITANTAFLRAAQGIGTLTDALETAVTNLMAENSSYLIINGVNTTTGDINIVNTGNLVVASILNSTPGGAVYIAATGSILDDGDDSTCIIADNIILTAGGDIGGFEYDEVTQTPNFVPMLDVSLGSGHLTATSTGGGNIYIAEQGSANLLTSKYTLNSSGDNTEIVLCNLTPDGDLTVDASPLTTGITELGGIDLGASRDIFVTNNFIADTTWHLGLHAYRNVNIAADLASAEKIQIEADFDRNGTGAINQTAGTIGTGSGDEELTLYAAEGINLINTRVAKLQATNTISGDINITNTGTLTLTNLDGSILDEGFDSGELYSIWNKGTGSVFIKTIGANADIISPSGDLCVVMAHGDVTLDAAHDLILCDGTESSSYGDVVTTAGTILLKAGNDIITKNDTYIYHMGDGTITLEAGNNITVAHIGFDLESAGITTKGTVNITAGGSILDDSDTVEKTQGDPADSTPSWIKAKDINLNAPNGNIGGFNNDGDGLAEMTAPFVDICLGEGNLIATAGKSIHINDYKPSGVSFNQTKYRLDCKDPSIIDYNEIVFANLAGPITIDGSLNLSDHQHFVALGDITINSPIISGAGALGFHATGNINVNSDIILNGESCYDADDDELESPWVDLEADMDGDGSGNINIGSVTLRITKGGGFWIYGKDVAIDIGAIIDAKGDGTNPETWIDVESSSHSEDMFLGNGAPVGFTGLILDQGEFNTLEADEVTIGGAWEDGCTGDIKIGQLSVISNIGLLILETQGRILNNSSSSLLTVSNLMLRAYGWIGGIFGNLASSAIGEPLDPLNTDVDNLIDAQGNYWDSDPAKQTYNNIYLNEVDDIYLWNINAGVVEVAAGGSITAGSINADTSVDLTAGGSILDDEKQCWPNFDSLEDPLNYSDWYSGFSRINSLIIKLTAQNNIGSDSLNDDILDAGYLDISRWSGGVFEVSSANGSIFLNLVNCDTMLGSEVSISTPNGAKVVLVYSGEAIPDGGGWKIRNEPWSGLYYCGMSFNINADLVLAARGNIWNPSALTTNSSLKLYATNDVFIGNNITSASGDIVIAADHEISYLGVPGDGSGAIIWNSGTISSEELTLYAATGIGSGNSIRTQVSKLRATNTTAGDIDIVNTGDIIVSLVLNSAPGAKISLSSSGSIYGQGGSLSNPNITAYSLYLNAGGDIGKDFYDLQTGEIMDRTLYTDVDELYILAGGEIGISRFPGESLFSGMVYFFLDAGVINGKGLTLESVSADRASIQAYGDIIVKSLIVATKSALVATGSIDGEGGSLTVPNIITQTLSLEAGLDIGRKKVLYTDIDELYAYAGGDIGNIVSDSPGISDKGDFLIKEILSGFNGGIPQFIQASFIELDKVEKVSRFRSGFGHNYTDIFEDARCMKHYFWLMPSAVNDTQLFSPVDGEIVVMREGSRGTSIQIKPDGVPGLIIHIFHVTVDTGLEVGDRVYAGQRLGLNPYQEGISPTSDIAIFLGHESMGEAATHFKLFSYFDAMSDAVFAPYAARGISSRSEFIISKTDRDNDPLTYNPADGYFITQGNIPNWVELDGPPVQPQQAAPAVMGTAIIKSEGDLTVGSVLGGTVDLTSDSGSILDDEDDMTRITADNIILTSGGNIGGFNNDAETLNKMLAPMLDVILGSGHLTAVSTGGGNIDIAEHGSLNLLTSDYTLTSNGANTEMSLVNLTENGDLTLDGSPLGAGVTALKGIDIAAARDIITDSDLSIIAYHLGLRAFRNVEINNDLSSAGKIQIEADSDRNGSGAIIQTAGTIGLGQEKLVLYAAEGITLTNTNVSKLQATNTTSGDINITNTGTLTLTNLDESILDEGFDSGSLYSIWNKGTGSVSIKTIGADADIISPSGDLCVVMAHGDVTLDAAHDLILCDGTDSNSYGDVLTTAGTILLKAGHDIITRNDTYIYHMGDGTITLEAGNNVTVAHIGFDLENAGMTTKGTVNITATNGSIFDDSINLEKMQGSGDIPSWIKAKTINLTAGGDIGSFNDEAGSPQAMAIPMLDVFLGFGNLTASATGNIYIAEHRPEGLTISSGDKYRLNCGDPSTESEIIFANLAGSLTIETPLALTDNQTFLAIGDLNLNAAISSSANDLCFAATQDVNVNAGVTLSGSGYYRPPPIGTFGYGPWIGFVANADQDASGKVKVGGVDILITHGGYIDFFGADIEINPLASINAEGDGSVPDESGVGFQPNNGTDPGIFLGSGCANTSGYSFILDQAEFDTLKADYVEFVEYPSDGDMFGNVALGDITIGTLIVNPLKVPYLSLRTKGRILNQDSNSLLTVGNLGLKAFGIKPDDSGSYDTAIGTPESPLNIKVVGLEEVLAGSTTPNKAYLNEADDIIIKDIWASTASITSGGAILDGNGNANNIIATDLIISAVNGICSIGDYFLETQVSNLWAANTTAGDIYIKNNGDLTVISVLNSAPNGTVFLASSGSILDDGNDATRITADNIFLTCNGNIGGFEFNEETQSPNLASMLDIELGAGNLTAVADGNIYIAEHKNANLPASKVTLISNGSDKEIGLCNLAGDITVDAPLSGGDDNIWLGANNIFVNSNFTTTGWSLGVHAFNNVTISANLSSVGRIEIDADTYGNGTGAINQTAGTIGSGSQPIDLFISAGSASTLGNINNVNLLTLSSNTDSDVTFTSNSASTFQVATVKTNYRAILSRGVGTGTSTDPIMIYSVSNAPGGLQYIQTSGKLGTSYYYKLANNIDASETSSWNNGAGFLPIGSDYYVYFSGSFNGNSKTIDSLYINRSRDNVGLFGYAVFATIQDFGLTNAIIIGNNYVASLVGFNNGSPISKVYSTGCTIQGNSYVGGLEGGNQNATPTFSNSYYNIDTTLINGDHIVTIYGIYNNQFTDWMNVSRTPLVIGNYFNLVSDYYEIPDLTRLKNLLAFADHSSTYKFKLTADIDLTSVPNFTIPYLYVQQFNGDNHVISNLSLNMPGLNYVGFFGRVNNVYIMNMSIINASVTGGNNVGILAGNAFYSGYNNYSNIRYCHSAGTVTGNSNVGGLVGNNISSYILYCDSTAAVNGGDGSSYIGGLVGSNNHRVYYSYCTGNVSAGSGSQYVGGLVGGLVGGSVSSASIKNTYSTGNVSAGSGSQYVGGLVGYNTYMIENSYYAGSAVSAGINSQYVGGLAGYSTSFGYISNSYYNIDNTLINGGHFITMYGIYNNQFTEWMNGSLVPLVASKYFNKNPVTGYYQISNLTDLKNLLSFTRSFNFELTNDIDLSPAPDFAIPCLSVNFNGNNHVISNLSINMPLTGYSGFFGRVSGTISNLGIVDATVTGNNYTGILAGWSQGTISNCYVTGTVTGHDYTGRLVGYANSCTISNCNVTGNVTGNNYTGILAGYASHSTISNCYTTGTITGNNNIGVLAGYIEYSTISGSHTAGAVTGNSYVGGLTGCIWYSTISNSYSPATVTGNSYVGGLAGWIVNSIVSSCSSAATVIGNDNSQYVGGLTGSFINCTTTGPAITGSYFTGIVNAGTGSRYVGGLAGSAAQSTISGCYSTGTINVASDNYHVGGLVGYNDENSTISDSYSACTVSSGSGLVASNDGTISNCYFTGTIIGSGCGLVAYNNFGTISNCYSTGNIGGVGAGLVGANNGGTVSNSYYNIDTVLINGSHFITTYGIYNDLFTSWMEASRAPLVIGTYFNLVGGYYEIPDLAHLKNFLAFANNSPTYKFKLTGNIDLTSVPNFMIPSLCVTEFNGAGHVISNLSINMPAFDVVGFFGGAKNCLISNIGIINAVVIGNNYVGILVGCKTSGTGPIPTIRNSYTTGTVTGILNVGGLVGQIIFSGISDCYSTAVVSGSGYVGGLVGYNSSATIYRSYATGDVAGNYHVGGLVGHIYKYPLENDQPAIYNSYSTGKIIADPEQSPCVGGFVGLNVGGFLAANNAWYTGSYSLAIGNDSFYGHIPLLSAVGYGFDAPSVSSFYDQSYSVYTAAGTTPWDISNSPGHTWIMAGYPHLQIEWSPTITNVYQLQMMTLNLSASYTLANNIDAADTQYWIPAGPINNGFSPVLNFSGALNGNSHNISNLYINRPYNGNIGLFANTNAGSSISNVSLTNVSITGLDWVGALVGDSRSIVTNCSASGSVAGINSYCGSIGGLIGNNYGSIDGCNAAVIVNDNGYNGQNIYNIGGLVGYNAGSISNCHATGSVTGEGDTIGGLVGYNYTGSITNSYATGEVRGHYSVGGLVGWNDIGDIPGSAMISNCYASGHVIGEYGYYNVGGLVGYNTADIIDSHATGNVDGCDTVGGLVGNNGGDTTEHNPPVGSIIHCYSTGNVTGRDSVGGLVGWNNLVPISKSYSTGSVTGTANHIGGLVGHNSGSISNCYNTGNVSGPGGPYGSVGGLVGFDTDGSISNSYNTGRVSGTNDIGGLVGWGFNGSISNSYNVGFVFGAANVGGLLGWISGKTVANCGWWTGAAAQPIGSGGAITYNESDPTAFYNSDHGVYTAGTPQWDFDNIWTIEEGLSYPGLR